MSGGEDPINRNDFTQFDESSRTVAEQEMFEWSQKWIKLRKENRALREGKTIDLFYDKDVYAFERKIDSESVIVGINNSDIMKSLNVPNAIEIPAKLAIYIIKK